MRVTEIYVERLKSYGDFSNRRLGLKAVMDEGEDLKEAYLKLAQTCETLLDIQEIQAEISAIELQKKIYEERRKELEQLKEDYYKIRSELLRELNELRNELEKIERLAEEKQLKLKDGLLDKLRKIRSALGFGYNYDP